MQKCYMSYKVTAILNLVLERSRSFVDILADFCSKNHIILISMSNVPCPFCLKLIVIELKSSKVMSVLKTNVLAMIPKQNEGQGHFKIILPQ